MEKKYCHGKKYYREKENTAGEKYCREKILQWGKKYCYGENTAVNTTGRKKIVQ